MIGYGDASAIIYLVDSVWFDCGGKIMLDEIRGDCQRASDGTDGRTGVPRRTIRMS
jgi:hypothetical protein